VTEPSPILPIVVRTYVGQTLEDATESFQADAAEMSAAGYSVVSQSWDQPNHARTLSVFAFLFVAAAVYTASMSSLGLGVILLILGLLMTALALVLRWDGTLSVTYQSLSVPRHRTRRVGPSRSAVGRTGAQ
jgi:hypothetical protein